MWNVYKNTNKKNVQTKVTKCKVQSLQMQCADNASLVGYVGWL